MSQWFPHWILWSCGPPCLPSRGDWRTLSKESAARYPGQVGVTAILAFCLAKFELLISLDDLSRAYMKIFLFSTASAVKLLQCPEPKTREEFLYCKSHIIKIQKKVYGQAVNLQKKIFTLNTKYAPSCPFTSWDFWSLFLSCCLSLTYAIPSLLLRFLQAPTGPQNSPQRPENL